MDIESRRQYLDQVRREYRSAEGGLRSQLLDEAEKRTELNRKYLIRVLGKAAPIKRRGGRKRRGAEYGAPEVTALIEIWDLFEQPCGQRLAAVLSQETGRLRQQGELHCSDVVAEKLGRMSASTIDRLLQREKRVRHLRRDRNPGMHPLLYQKIPVKVAGEWDRSEVGNLQVDFVAHCGRSTGGEYLHTLSAVDIATQWWEGQAIASRSQHATKEGLTAIRGRFPFRIRELHPDNDSALINDLLWSWCRQERIGMSRSRPYKKNDNAWVEQKNWTHVRKVVGYRRYDHMRELKLLNEIYGVLRLYKNFFLPVIKLQSKMRIGGRIRRVYEVPRTPYQRVLESRDISRLAKQELRSVYQGLNAAALHRRLGHLRDELERVSGAQPELAIPPAPRGYGIQLRKKVAVRGGEVRGSAPNPAGAAPLRPAWENPTSLEGKT